MLHDNFTMQNNIDTQNILFVIDGYNFIFRAYYVQPSLIAQGSTPVGALYGFSSMLLKIVEHFNPKELVIVLDHGGKNFRHKLYDKYKANREATPNDLIIQLKLLRKIITLFNCKILEQPEVEADDVIATLAKRAKEAKKYMTILSADKDLLQLMGEYVKIYDPIKSCYITEEDVMNKFGVTPDKIHDVQALIGDSSDNIPGVHSIGPKTAAKLINQFSTIKSLYDSIDKLSNKRQQQLLLDQKDMAFLSWDLAKLKDDVEIIEDINDFHWNYPNQSQINSLIYDFEFTSLQKRIQKIFNIVADENKSIIDNNVQKINIIDDQNIENQNNIFSDIERLGLVAVSIFDQKEQVNIYLATEESTYALIYPIEDLSNGRCTHYHSFSFLQKILSDQSIKKIIFNIKSFFKYIDTPINSYEDLQLMDYCLSSGLPNKSILELIKHYDHNKEDEYFALNNEITSDFLHIYNLLVSELHKNKLLYVYYNVDLPLSRILNNMEKNGIMLDIELLNRLSIEFGSKINKLEEKIFSITGHEFNISSPKQLGEILFDKLKLPFGQISKKSKTYVTNYEVLNKLAANGYEIAQILLQHRHLSKLKNTYTDSLPKQVNLFTKRIHTTFLQTSTTTTRLSSNNPNVQNIPIKTKEGYAIRSTFIAPDGYQLISADYSQIELRILSYVANIDSLKEAFIKGEDIHAYTASQIFGVEIKDVTKEMRNSAKSINFGIIYGISPYGLAMQLNISIEKAKNYIENYFKQYAGIKEYMENTIEFAEKNGYVTNILGRKCFIPAIYSKNSAIKSFGKREAINAGIQSLASDIIKLAMINIDNKFNEIGVRTKILLQVHDELVFESPNEEIEKVKPIIKDCMVNALPLEGMLIDVKIYTGLNWKEMH